MRITLSPQRRDDTLTLLRSGEVLTINGEDFDFTDLPNGETIPAGVVPSEFIVGPVSRIDGMLSLTLILPVGPNASHAQNFPDPIIDPSDGPVALPGD